VKKIQTLKNVILYVVLAKYDNEQSDLIHRYNARNYLNCQKYLFSLIGLRERS
jgi:hypothetical protein